MENQKIQSLINYYETVAKTAESLKKSEVYNKFDEKKKVANDVAVKLFQDTAEALKIAISKNLESSQTQTDTKLSDSLDIKLDMIEDEKDIQSENTL